MLPLKITCANIKEFEVNTGRLFETIQWEEHQSIKAARTRQATTARQPKKSIYFRPTCICVKKNLLMRLSDKNKGSSPFSFVSAPPPTHYLDLVFNNLRTSDMFSPTKLFLALLALTHGSSVVSGQINSPSAALSIGMATSLNVRVFFSRHDGALHIHC